MFPGVLGEWLIIYRSLCYLALKVHEVQHMNKGIVSASFSKISNPIYKI